MMPRPVRELYGTVLIQEWLQATEQALETLQEWRKMLTAWGNGGLVSRADLRRALDLLDAAGLAEWAEWGAGQDLDELAGVTDAGADDDTGEDEEDAGWLEGG